MIYTTLKANREAGNDYIDIITYCDETLFLVASLFENPEKYYHMGSDDYTDFDVLFKDYTERQVASACLKYLKTLIKDKEEPFMEWNKIIFELDCDGEIAYDYLEVLIEEGTITGSQQLKEIQNKASKKGCTIKKEYRYEENDIYYGVKTISDLIDEHFPCYAETHDDDCNNCGNCW